MTTMTSKDELMLSMTHQVVEVNKDLKAQKSEMDRAKESLTEERKAYEKLVNQVSELISDLSDIEAGQYNPPLPMTTTKPDEDMRPVLNSGDDDEQEPEELGPEVDVSEIDSSPELVLPDALDDLPDWFLSDKNFDLISDDGTLKTPADLVKWVNDSKRTKIKGIGPKAIKHFQDGLEKMQLEDANDDDIDESEVPY